MADRKTNDNPAAHARILPWLSMRQKNPELEMYRFNSGCGQLTQKSVFTVFCV
jgi:hypothetical protein